jgi:hypothetical protein
LDRIHHHISVRSYPPSYVRWIISHQAPSAILGPIPSTTGARKFDMNNCGFNPIHTDMVGGSWEYPEANYRSLITHSLTYSLTHARTRSLTLTPSLTHSLAHSLTHSLTRSLTLTPSLTRSLTRSLAHSLSLPPSLAHSLTHSLTLSTTATASRFGKRMWRTLKVSCGSCRRIHQSPITRGVRMLTPGVTAAMSLRRQSTSLRSCTSERPGAS